MGARLFFSLWVLMGVLHAGCGQPKRGALESAVEAWEQGGIVQYEMVTQKLCFCIGTEPVRVEVDAGGIVSAIRLLQEGEETVDPGDYERYFTVAGHFDIIREAIDEDASDLQVEYHPSLHYPEEIDIDWIHNAIDDEVTYAISELTPL